MCYYLTEVAAGMGLLRRTIPVSLKLGAVLAVIVATFQAIDGIFANPGLITTVGYLLAYLGRVYFLYFILLIVLSFVLNLLLCIFIPRKLARSDYARLLEWELWANLFVLLLLIYLWKDKTTVGELIRERRGVLPKIFYSFELLFIFGLLSFIVAGAVHQLVTRLKKGQLALYISSVMWFVLLFPLAGETIYILLPKLNHIVQLIILIILAFVLSFVIKFLNRFTMGIIGMKRSSWAGLIIIVILSLAIWGIVSFLQPRTRFHPRSGDSINIVLFSIDALRADHLGCYGYDPDIPEIEPGKFTPNIDKFAAEGLLFEQAYSSSPWTLPSISSWMTGGWPTETGGTYVNRRVYGAMTTLAEALAEEGYDCAGFTSNPFLGPQTGIGRGFNDYWEYFHASHLSSGLFIDEFQLWLINKLDILGLRPGGRAMVDKQMGRTYQWLQRHKREKFFLWVHLYDPHYPWAPPSPYKEDLPDIGGERRPAQFRGLPAFRMGAAHLQYGMRRHIVDLYDGEVRFSDEVVGDFLAKLDQLDLTRDTLVVITSDHGDEFFDHGGLEHGHTVYHEVLHVPLIFRLPGRIPEGERITERTSMIDLFPTMLDFGRASVEPKVYRGESLMDAVLNGDMSYAGNGQLNLTSWSGGKQVSFDISEWDEGASIEDNRDVPELDIGTPQPPSPMEITGKAAEKMRSEASSRSLVPLGSRVIFSEDLFYYDHDLKGISIGDWKLIHSRNRFHDPFVWNLPGVFDEYSASGPHFVEGDELYNITDDPDEIKNVIYEYPEVARYLRKRLNEIVYYDQLEAMTRENLEGKETYFGAGLKNLTRGYGYW